LILLGLSLAGEKMPWLSTHITIRYLLLAAWLGRTHRTAFWLASHHRSKPPGTPLDCSLPVARLCCW
jgi:hypothetical protein